MQRMSRSDQGGPGGKTLERIERFTEVPLLVLAVLYIPVFIVEYLPEVHPEVRRDADVLQWAIVAAFAAVLVLKVAVAERRLEYLRSRWLEVLIVALPFLRPLRLLLVLPFLMRAIVGLRRVLGPYRGIYVLVSGLLTILTGAGLVLLFERRVESSPIDTFWDALWWAITTITTVGYGDTYPTTPSGRIVAALVMLVGIALFGVLTAGVAAYFVERSEEEEEKERDDKIDLILERLDEQEKRDKKVDLLLEKVQELERRTEGQGAGPDKK